MSNRLSLYRQLFTIFLIENSVFFSQQHALLNRVENATNEVERAELRKISQRQSFAATLLPIRTVGVQVQIYNRLHFATEVLLYEFIRVTCSLFQQGDKRSFSYAVGISSKREPESYLDWQDLYYYAKIIPRICTSVNRVCYVYGGIVKDQINDITPTYLTGSVCSAIRQADYIVNQVIKRRFDSLFFIARYFEVY